MGATTVLLKIGEVAERSGLSQRTLRFYEEEGLVVPGSRSGGGFRLYSEAEVRRLELVKPLKPLGFSVQEMREVLAVLDALDGLDGPAGDAERVELVERLDAHRARVEQTSADLLAKAARGRDLARHLAEVVERHAPA